MTNRIDELTPDDSFILQWIARGSKDATPREQRAIDEARLCFPDFPADYTKDLARRVLLATRVR